MEIGNLAIDIYPLHIGQCTFSSQETSSSALKDSYMQLLFVCWKDFEAVKIVELI